MDSRPASPPHPERDTSSADGLRRITSKELLGKDGQIVITHQGREYRLRITQNGKLILTA
jgi:hemin uptake protein HemP